MNKKSKFNALMLVSSMISVTGVAQAEFVAGMTPQQVSQEVAAQLNAGMDLDVIIKAAHEGSLSPDQVTNSLIQAG